MFSAFAIIVSVIIQSGVFAAPVISMTIPNNWKIGYKVLIGAMAGMILSAIKEFFTDKERERQTNEMKEKMEQMKNKLNKMKTKLKNHDTLHQNHIERLSNHDERLSNHDERLSNHDERLSNHDLHLMILKEEIEFNKPFVYQPFDPMSDEE